MKQRSNYIFGLVFAALCLAIGIAIKSLGFFIPIGIPILKISFDGPPIRLVAVLFGPVFGGIIGALADFLGFFLTNKSGNAWIPLLTITFALNMTLVGFLWRYFRKKKTETLRIQYLLVIILILVYGAVSFGVGFHQRETVTDTSISTVAVERFLDSGAEVEQILNENEEKVFEENLHGIQQMVSEANALISKEKLEEALSVWENEGVKTFEKNISDKSKATLKVIAEQQKEIETASISAEDKKVMALCLEQAKDAIKAIEGQMKRAREIRRQLLGGIVVMIVAFLGMIIYFINKWIAKNQEIQGVADYFFQMFLSIFIPGILSNWVNTYILFQILFQNQKKDIFLFGFFRSAVNLMEVYYNTLVVLFLIILLQPLLKKRGIYPFGEKNEQYELGKKF